MEFIVFIVFSVFLFSLNYLDNLFFDRFQRFFTVPIPVLNLESGPVPGSWKHLPVRFLRKPGTRKPCQQHLCEILLPPQKDNINSKIFVFRSQKVIDSHFRYQ